MIFLELFLTFLKIGAFTFGGGYAMLPLVQEAVLSNGWMSEQEMIDFIAVSESTPGPFAVNMATYVGARTAGVFGSLAATFGVVLPSFIIILIVAKFLTKFSKNPVVRGCMSGLRPAVIGLIGAALISILRTVFTPSGFDSALFTAPTFWFSLSIFLAACLLSFKKVHPIIVILISAALGVAAGYAFGL